MAKNTPLKLSNGIIEEYYCPRKNSNVQVMNAPPENKTGDAIALWLANMADDDLIYLLEQVSQELKQRNLMLKNLGGQSKDEAVQQIADALLTGIKH
ncbi:MAG TPA: hypothetical protein VIE65_04275 [Methylobacter sp.]|jgi:hypothetical protein